MWGNKFLKRVATRRQHHEGTNSKARDRKPSMSVCCIQGSQCAPCPWVGSGTLLCLSPRPAVNLKWRRSWETATGGRVTHRSLSFLLWIFIFPLPHDDTSSFSFSLTYTYTSPPCHCLPTFSWETLQEESGRGAGSLSKQFPVPSRKVWWLTGTEGAGFTRPLWSNTHRCIFSFLSLHCTSQPTLLVFRL